MRRGAELVVALTRQATLEAAALLRPVDPGSPGRQLGDIGPVERPEGRETVSGRPYGSRMDAAACSSWVWSPASAPAWPAWLVVSPFGGAGHGGGAEQRAEHQATVRAAVDAAVDTVVKVAGERLGAQADAGSRELATRQHAFEQQVGELRGSMVDQLALRNAAVEQHMGDVRAELSRVGELVASLQRERAEQQGRVETRLSEMAAVSARLVDTTQSLRQALANPRLGPVGRAHGRRRAAGRRPGRGHQLPQAVGHRGGHRARLPLSCCPATVLHMDVKFPVDNYLRYLEATSERERDQHAIAFVRDVRPAREAVEPRLHRPRRHPRRGAAVHPQRGGLRAAHQHDRDLLDVALQQKVVLCSPSTLFSVLAVIRQAVEQTRLQRTSDEILACLAAFEQQWSKFSDALDKVGRSLDTVRRSWDDLSGTRRRQLERELDRVGEPAPGASSAATAGPVTRRTSRSRPATRASPATPRRGAGRRARSFRCPGRRRRQRADQRRSGGASRSGDRSRSERRRRGFASLAPGPVGIRPRCRHGAGRTRRNGARPSSRRCARPEGSCGARRSWPTSTATAGRASRSCWSTGPATTTGRSQGQARQGRDLRAGRAARGRRGDRPRVRSGARAALDDLPRRQGAVEAGALLVDARAVEPWQANDEIDDRRWVTLDDARGRLTYCARPAAARAPSAASSADPRRPRSPGQSASPSQLAQRCRGVHLWFTRPLTGRSPAVPTVLSGTGAGTRPRDSSPEEGIRCEQPSNAAWRGFRSSWRSAWPCPPAAATTTTMRRPTAPPRPTEARSRARSTSRAHRPSSPSRRWPPRPSGENSGAEIAVDGPGHRGRLRAVLHRRHRDLRRLPGHRRGGGRGLRGGWHRVRRAADRLRRHGRHDEGRQRRRRVPQLRRPVRPHRSRGRGRRHLGRGQRDRRRAGPSTELPDAELVLTGPGTESGTDDSFVELALEGYAEERGQEPSNHPHRLCLVGRRQHDRVEHRVQLHVARLGRLRLRRGGGRHGEGDPGSRPSPTATASSRAPRRSPTTPTRCPARCSST